MTQSTLAAAKIPTRRDRLVAYASAAGLLTCILAANFVTSKFGIVPVGFGLMATAGTYFAGLTFVLRDAFQDAAGQAWTLAVIAAGAALSFILADPFIALASAVAFVSSEVADLVVYTPLRKRGYIRAAVASNVVGSFVDTVIFLSIAGFPIQDAIAGQMVGKLVITGVAIAVVIGFRLWRTSRAESA